MALSHGESVEPEILAAVLCIGFDPAVGRLRQVQGLVGGAAGVVVGAKCARLSRARGGAPASTSQTWGELPTPAAAAHGGLPTNTASLSDRHTCEKFFDSLLHCCRQILACK